LEGFVSNDLEPVNHTLGARKGVQMGISSQFLARGDIEGLPIEQE
jgi:hypothetical protein